MWQVCPVARERWSRLRLKLAHPSQFNRIYISGKGAVVSPEIETQSRSASASVKSGWQGSGGLAVSPEIETMRKLDEVNETLCGKGAVVSPEIET